jgi:hypothetical protein
MSGWNARWRPSYKRAIDRPNRLPSVSISGKLVATIAGLRCFAAMAHFPQPHPSVRAPRVRVPNSESVNFSLDGKRVPAVLHEISITGGLAQFSGAVREGSLAELQMQSKAGPITGLVELLRPRTRSAAKVQAFRFVALDEKDHERLASVLRQMVAQGFGV